MGEHAPLTRSLTPVDLPQPLMALAVTRWRGLRCG